LTLVELLAVLGIVVVIATLLVGVVSRMHGIGDRAKCTTNLRVLYIGLDSYLKNVGNWPQQPHFGQNEETEYGQWWIDKLKPYDVSEAAWKCPGITRLGSITKDGGSPLISYSPTMFDSNPITPLKWSNMPWLVEIGNIHGNGALMIFPDGSVRDLDNVMVDQAR
jgi:type II secretory pathway pseudopilin PulG